MSEKKQKVCQMKSQICWISVFFILGMLSGCSKSEDEILLPPMNVQTQMADQPAGDQTGSSAVAQSADFSGAGTKETDELQIYVHVCGCVKTPGVYVLDEGSRVYQALEAAGGVTDEGDLSSVNLAMVLRDEMRIDIPSVYDMQDASEAVVCVGSAGLTEAAGNGAGETALININTADEAALMTLTGIGQSRAQDIIKYREIHGGFETIEDVMKVSGIKTSVFEKIKDQITVN